MIWGGSCVGIGLLVVPYIFNHLESPTEASILTSKIFQRQDILIRIIAICMLVLFYLKSKLVYSYQHIEWITYVLLLHCFIFGKVISKKLWKLREAIDTFDAPIGKDPQRLQFRRWHISGRILYIGQIIGVVALLYLHAFGL